MRLFRLIGYFLLFLVAFLYFLYRFVPYEAVKDRVLVNIERRLGGKYQINVKKLQPHYFTGLALENVELSDRDKGTILQLERLTGRVSALGLIFGQTRVSFSLKFTEGSVKGFTKPFEEGWVVELDVKNFDLGSVAYIKNNYGIETKSDIDGRIDVRYNDKASFRSVGNIKLDLGSVQIKSGKLMIFDTEIDVPEIILSKRSGSKVIMDMDKGILDIKEFTLKDGDLEIDLKGKVFLSQVVSNWRVKIEGKFKFSDKLSKDLPFLFIIDRQKQPDGYFPIDITGRFDKPVIKVGDFTVPL